ncbi:DNA-binding protein RFX8 [Erethizon dorsatum]
MVAFGMLESRRIQEPLSPGMWKPQNKRDRGCSPSPRSAAWRLPGESRMRVCAASLLAAATHIRDATKAPRVAVQVAKRGAPGRPAERLCRRAQPGAPRRRPHEGPSRERSEPRTCRTCGGGTQLAAPAPSVRILKPGALGQDLAIWRKGGRGTACDPGPPRRMQSAGPASSGPHSRAPPRAPRSKVNTASCGTGAAPTRPLTLRWAMAEGPADPRGLHGRILRWLVDNFCICEGYSMPRCLVYEIYVETCGQNAQNQVSPATFGKLVHLAFPDLGTRRLGTRGSARYHYDGICIKKNSFFYSQYCCLLGEKRSPSCHTSALCLRQAQVTGCGKGSGHGTESQSCPGPQTPARALTETSPRTVPQATELSSTHSRITPTQPSLTQSGDQDIDNSLDIGRGGRAAVSSGAALAARWPCACGTQPGPQLADVQSRRRRPSGPARGDSEPESLFFLFMSQASSRAESGSCRSPTAPALGVHECENNSPLQTGPVGLPLSEIRRCPLWEQELAKKYSCTMMAFLADKYCSYCQDILQNVRNQELERVQDLLTSFWKSLQQDVVMFMALPDVCQLLKSYDTQLYKGLEDLLLRDFLDDVSIQYLKSVRLFSKKFKWWLLNALEGFPSLLQVSQLKEVTMFVKRLRRKTYLSNMAKTMRTVLKNSRKIRLLKSDLQAIVSQGALDISPKPLESDGSHTEEAESYPEMKCLSCLISLLGTSADLRVFLNCLSSNLQAFVFQPSKSKEEFMKLAASFQLKWNFLLTAVSKAMTLCHRDSFGSWHLFHLLLLEYVTHMFQSCLEEEEEEEDTGNLKEALPDVQPLAQPVQALFHPLGPAPPQDSAHPSTGPPRVTLEHQSHSLSPVGVSSVVLWVLGFLVDTATGNKHIQVLLEDKATKSATRLSLPVGEEALVSLKDGRRFVIHISNVP